MKLFVFDNDNNISCRIYLQILTFLNEQVVTPDYLVLQFKFMILNEEYEFDTQYYIDTDLNNNDTNPTVYCYCTTESIDDLSKMLGKRESSNERKDHRRYSSNNKYIETLTNDEKQDLDYAIQKSKPLKEIEEFAIDFYVSKLGKENNLI